MSLLVEAVELVEPTGGEAEAQTATIRPAREVRFSLRFACGRCGASYEELSPHQYSFNSAMGWCETCEGLGVQRGAPVSTLIPQPKKTLFTGAIAGWWQISRKSAFGKMLAALCRRIGVPADAPLSEWTTQQVNALLFGLDRSTDGERTDPWIDGGEAFGPNGAVRFQWRGFFPAIDAATRANVGMRHRLRNAVTEIPCLACRGGRIRPDAAATRFGGRTIVEVSRLPLAAAARFFDELRLSKEQRQVSGELLREVRQRLAFLLDVGLDYLTLHRAAPSLSGGESQRIRLASQARQRAFRRSVCTGRADDRPSSARHAAAYPGAAQAARPGQHAADGRARSRRDALRRPAARLRPARRQRRRADRRALDAR
ncbi:MAG: hypothetical protein IPM64_14380 [Phycisphaerales bacterium]|nr:hypothetical protein [Phycisphaerales bacterium]